MEHERDMPDDAREGMAELARMGQQMDAPERAKVAAQAEAITNKMREAITNKMREAINVALG